MNIIRNVKTFRLCYYGLKNNNNNYKNVRNYSIESPIIESIVRQQTGIFKTISESTPVEYAQKLLLTVHDSTGLPWWATIISTTILLRCCITVPLAVYQNYILAKIENINVEMGEISKELKKEVGIAVKLYNWDEKTARYNYRRSISKQYDNLIIRDNCHPFKTAILAIFQIPMWVSLSVSLRNLVYMLPNQDINAQMVYTQLCSGGFGWIPNLVEVDSSLILPITYGLLNLTIIEIQTLSRVRVPSKLQTYLTNVFRVFSIFLIPIAASVPSVIINVQISKCLVVYWTTSSAFGLVQNLVLMSPKVKRFCRIPQTPSELENPYQYLIAGINLKIEKIFKFNKTLK